jgi:acetyl-CoA carboxylase biotin carboxyl carrier protein
MARRMAILGFELEDIARLITLVETQGLDELIFEEEGRYLRIRGPRQGKRERTVVQTMVTPPPAPAAQARPRALPSPPTPAASAGPPPEDQIALVSPMVGIFYRAEKPGAPPLVKVGDHISVDQTVAVIEAMKVFSEFKSEFEGTVVSIPAQDGQLVQAGMPLILLKKD